MKKLFNSKNWDEYRILKNIAFASLWIGIGVLITFITVVLINNRPSANFDNELTQTIGSFIGGVVPVFISIATVLLIYITFKSNREEFKEINKSNDKIIAANNFQQFNTTFESMSLSLIELINEYKEKKIIENIVQRGNWLFRSDRASDFGQMVPL